MVWLTVLFNQVVGIELPSAVQSQNSWKVYRILNPMAESLDRVLSSSRLVLEPIQGRHSDLLFDLLQDASIYSYIPTEPPETKAALQVRYAWLAQRHSPEGDEIWLNWAIRLGDQSVDDKALYIGTVQATILADGKALLAYELGSTYRGAGYATEACQTVMRELVEGYEVQEIQAYVDTRNARSILLLERLGFSRSSYIPQADFFKGVASDEYVYSWQAQAE